MCRGKVQVRRKSVVEVTESERCELVLNAVFYWEPVEFCQKRCDMISLRRPGFFSMGVARACFNPDWTVPVDTETLTILVTRWASWSCRHCFVRVAGMGSRVQLFLVD